MALKVLILSRTPGAYSTQRLKEACAAHGHSARVLNTMGLSLRLESARPELYYRNLPISSYDAAIPRIGASISGYGTRVVRQLEQMGVFTLNSAQAIAASRDKLSALQIMVGHGLGIPPTAFVRERDRVRAAIAQVGGAPVILKLVEGSQGAGVILADTLKVAESILETLLLSQRSVMVQKFVSESRGRDLRALVVGSRVVAAMCRRAAPDEFRSNVHRGGRAERVELDPETERVALRAAQVLGLQVAGVDLIESADGPLLLEVNSSPGLEGIETATGIDVADEIVQHLEAQVAFPSIDVQQRLTAAGAHGVLELELNVGSWLAGRTVGEMVEEEASVRVLCLSREATVFPNPGPELKLEAGDRVLCFGPYSALRGFLRGPRSERRLPVRAGKPAEVSAGFVDTLRRGGG